MQPLTNSSLRIFLLTSLLLPTTTSTYEAKCPEGRDDGFVSGPGCTTYFICANKKVVSPITDCQPGTLFDEGLSVCDYDKSECVMYSGMIFYELASRLFCSHHHLMLQYIIIPIHSTQQM